MVRVDSQSIHIFYTRDITFTRSNTHLKHPTFIFHPQLNSFFQSVLSRWRLHCRNWVFTSCVSSRGCAYACCYLLPPSGSKWDCTSALRPGLRGVQDVIWVTIPFWCKDQNMFSCVDYVCVHFMSLIHNWPSEISFLNLNLNSEGAKKELEKRGAIKISIL